MRYIVIVGLFLVLLSATLIPLEYSTENKGKKPTRQDKIDFLREYQEDIVREWTGEIAIIEDTTFEDAYAKASAFLSLMIKDTKLTEGIATDDRLRGLMSEDVSVKLATLRRIIVGYLSIRRRLKGSVEGRMWPIFNVISKELSEVSEEYGGDIWGSSSAVFSVEKTPWAVRWREEAASSCRGPEPALMGMVFYYADMPRKMLSVPVNVGDSWSEVCYYGLRGTTTVEGDRERVTVAAGTFGRCLKLKTIIAKGEGVDSPRRKASVFRSGTRFMWFAPGVGLVKLRYSHGDGTTTDIQLVGYSTPSGEKEYFPLKVGNIWKYEWTNGYRDYVVKETCRVVSQDGDVYRISCFNGR